MPLKNKTYNCLVVLGPTASGKTHMACQLAYKLNGEIISADSRQVYKGLDIGTGKDLYEYVVQGKQIPYHLIDVCEVETQFYFPDFIRHLKKAFSEITERNHLPIICGGTGLYLEALEKDHSYTQIPENLELRKQLNELTKNELIERLRSLEELITLSGVEGRQQPVDLNSEKRIIRGIEIAEYLKTNPLLKKEENIYHPKYIGINIGKDERNERIDERLKLRIANGLIEEVEGLLQRGVTHEKLQYLGLEYKYISHYLLGNINKEELFTQLSTAIHQFAKRQMTWFRRMERNGVQIEWVDKENFEYKNINFE